MSEMKKLIDECAAAEAAAAEAGKKLPMLTTKLDTAEQKTEALNAAVNRTEQAKETALSDFVLDKATEDDVDAARENHEAALQTLKHNAELIGALTRQIDAIEKQVPDLHNKARVARQRVFEHRYNEIVVETKSRLGDSLIRAWACRMLSGAANLNDVARDLLGHGHVPDPEAVKRIQVELEAEVFGDRQGKQAAA